MEVLRRKCSKKLKNALIGRSKLKAGGKEKKEESISKPRRLARFVAIADYSVQAAGEIPLSPGLVVEVVEKSDSGWWFVNSADQQGWVPSTYLQPEDGDSDSMQAPRAAQGEEENHICIEKFEANSEDEISLEKGTVVQVIQKNMDGWWLVRYGGREAYAPGTYLKKATNAHTLSLVEKSRMSGVEIISSLSDVSNLLKQEDGKPGEGPSGVTSQQDVSPPPQLGHNNNNSINVPRNDRSPPSRTSALLKQSSLERGGSLKPPPRQNSIKRSEAPKLVSKSSVYMTVDDFVDSVGDGLSFKRGERVYVMEKTPSGWWFVKINDREGWVPSSYLESSVDGDIEECQDIYDVVHDASDDSFSSSSDEENIRQSYIEPSSVHTQNNPTSSIADALKFKFKSSKQAGDESKTSSQQDKRPLPPVPAVEDSHPAPASKPALPTKAPLSITKSKDFDQKKPGPGKPELKATASAPIPSEGPNDNLASVLKAKFESRQKEGDVGNSSTSKPNFPQPQKPSVALKPPTSHSNKHDQNSPRSVSPSSKEVSSDSGPMKKPFAKPQPPSKAKPSPPKLSPKPGQADSTKGVPLKPPSKPTSGGPMRKDLPGLPPKSDGKDGESSQEVSVKNLAAAFNTKPAVMAKPGSMGFAKPEKPKPLSKPQLPGKPAVNQNKPVTNTQKCGSGVANLSNMLSGKLQFGQPPPSKENGDLSGEADSAPVRVTPSVKPSKPSSPPVVSSKRNEAQTAMVMFDFAAENEGEISLAEGDEVELVETQGDWSLVRFYDDEGWVPTTYLELQ